MCCQGPTLENAHTKPWIYGIYVTQIHKRIMSCQVSTLENARTKA